jgi:hypothetical protein
VGSSDILEFFGGDDQMAAYCGLYTKPILRHFVPHVDERNPKTEGIQVFTGEKALGGDSERLSALVSAHTALLAGESDNRITLQI